MQAMKGASPMEIKALLNKYISHNITVLLEPNKVMLEVHLHTGNRNYLSVKSCLQSRVKRRVTKITRR